MALKISYLIVAALSFVFINAGHADDDPNYAEHKNHLISYETASIKFEFPTEIKRRDNPLGWQRQSVGGRNEVHFFSGDQRDLQSLYNYFKAQFHTADDSIFIDCHGHNGGCGFYTPREFIRHPERARIYSRHFDIFNLHRHDYSLFATANSGEQSRHVFIIFQKSSGSDGALLALDITYSRADDTAQENPYEKMKKIEKEEDSSAKEMAPLRIYFDSNSSEITEANIIILEEMAARIAQSDKQYAIVGHTDNRGDPEFNQKLANARAKAVYSALQSRLGDNSNLTHFFAHGPDTPIADNDSSDGRSMNRRVELTVVNSLE